MSRGTRAIYVHTYIYIYIYTDKYYDLIGQIMLNNQSQADLTLIPE